MFRIECFCDDKKLAKVLWLLTSAGVYNVTSTPVANAQKANGQVRARVPNADKVKMLQQYMTKHKLKEITPPQMKAFMTGLGMRPKNYSNMLRDAVKAGVLTRVGHSYNYRLK